MTLPLVSGDDTILLFDTMDKLRAQAAAQGGRVLSLLGNHEWMNAIGTSMLVPHNFVLL